jgi:hypothetical protein
MPHCSAQYGQCVDVWRRVLPIDHSIEASVVPSSHLETRANYTMLERSPAASARFCRLRSLQATFVNIHQSRKSNRAASEIRSSTISSDDRFETHIRVNSSS